MLFIIQDYSNRMSNNKGGLEEYNREKNVLHIHICRNIVITFIYFLHKHLFPAHKA